VRFNIRALTQPQIVSRHSGTEEIAFEYQKQTQNFAWLEPYLARFPSPEKEKLITDRRPLYNRGLGGHLTAYFYPA